MWLWIRVRRIQAGFGDLEIEEDEGYCGHSYGGIGELVQEDLDVVFHESFIRNNGGTSDQWKQLKL